jgi:putative transposase
MLYSWLSLPAQLIEASARLVAENTKVIDLGAAFRLRDRKTWEAVYKYQHPKWNLARKHGISEATLYNWKAKYGGLTISEAKRLRALEDENGKLKKLLADAMLDNAALKELLSKNW